ncbi:uncharacterized protein LOC129741312 [Uranotaenia lowii]|uniref:uncharacterized protein LOC129741312 n=1 Tax=Uranotaenia lowii TaxID=190385 RepID=UPI00247AB754|nr:uncharacterized protein LOC129741312 [Uranotaenia lowii]
MGLHPASSSDDDYNTTDMGNAHNCVACVHPDSADDLVACDRCDSWWHYSCAGVDDGVKNHQWVCAKCANVPTKASSIRTTSSVRKARLELELKRLEEEKELERRFIAAKYRALEESLQEEEGEKESLRLRESDPDPAEKQKSIVNWVTEQTESVLEGVAGVTKQLKHQPERITVAPEKPNDQVYLENPFVATEKDPTSRKRLMSNAFHQLEKQLHSCQEQDNLSSEQLLELQDQLRLCQIHLTENNTQSTRAADVTLPQVKLQPSTQPKPKPTGTKPKASPHFLSKTTKLKDGALLNEAVMVASNLRKQKGPPQISPRVPVGQEMTEHAVTVCAVPSQQQLATRQMLPRDLPIFSGNPADWPVFISQYNYTTEACGFSPGENMIRLQRCLKGPAWEAVRSRLMLPASVPHVIEALRMRYGRPELLIESLIQKLKETAPPKADKLDTLIDFGTKVQALCDHVEAADMVEHLANPTLMRELVSKLPADYRMKWASYRRSGGTVNLRMFGNFMEEVVIDAYSVTSYSEEQRSLSKREKIKPDQSLVHADTGGSVENHQSHVLDHGVFRERNQIMCAACNQEGHRSKDCRTFLNLSVDARWKLVQKLGLCRTCLFDHGRRTCRNPNRCGVNGCEARHNPLLHSTRTESLSGSTPNGSSTSVVHHIHESLHLSLLFRIIPVTLYNGDNSISTFAFVDEGSSLTMVETELADQLGLKGHYKPLCLKWTANVTRTESESRRVDVEISGPGQSKRFVMSSVGTIQALELPIQSLPIEALKQRFKHLRGLPIQGYADAIPRVLIGVDNLKLVLPLKAREGSEGQPIAVRTRLGWSVYGGQRDNKLPTFNYHSCECDNETAMNDILKTYFDLEETGVKPSKNLLSAEDERALRLLEETTKFVGNCYESGLLWRYDHIELPNSYSMALGRCRCLEKKMAKDPAMKRSIFKQIEDYQQKGYCHRATPEELKSFDPRRTWFLPLGAVTNPKKPGKVRLVWDAAAKAEGISLNSMLLKGPDQLSSLPNVLFRFRQYPVAVCADIREMFHQIRIREVDRCSQLFLWRTNPDNPPDIFVMDVATFGSTSSPATAQFVKNINAQRFADQYPTAVENIVSAHYVDDYCTSFATVEEAQQISNQVRKIHQHGGFELRNFCSNDMKVLRYLGEQEKNAVKDLNPLKGNTAERVLGILWGTEQDQLFFPTIMSDEMTQLIETKNRPTKRLILKCVMTLFDPLGLLAPYLVFGKMLVQEVWRKGFGWDDSVDDEIYSSWEKWTALLAHIKDIRIPRSYFDEAAEVVELHTFVDASESACACVSYFRFVDSFGKVQIALVAGKSKVAPLKPWSVPRLELHSCLMGARLTRFVQEGHSIRIIKRTLWTDSRTAMSWINGDPRKYTRFVAFRLTEITELTQRSEWRWVPSRMNPADEATKWSKTSRSSNHGIWFTGPAFLKLPEKEWPEQKVALENETVEELRSCHIHLEDSIPQKIIDVNRFSKWNRLLRTMAYVFRFIRNAKSPEQRTIGCLKRYELEVAENALFKLTQWEVFSDEMAVLTKNQKSSFDQCLQIAKNSSLYKLTPAIDSSGLLRMDSRIGSARNVPNDMKHPIILPKNHKLTFLILSYYHCKFNHGNSETVVNEVRQRFYIPALRQQVKLVCKKCQHCRIYKCRPVAPRMAPLPSARMSPQVRPFSYVGLDYFGPLLVKVGRSQVKRWVALFTCLTIRAVHLEVIFNLSTESCIFGIRRFISRRGAPVEFHTDNGTNFQGAERVLREQINAGLESTFTNTQTAWHFIPPGAPHMGGAWERMVRSIKTAMIEAYSENLDDERLYTVLVEAESIVNSRPLTYLPLESSYSEAITPNHFLLGSSSGIRQPTTERKMNSNLLSRSWDIVQRQLDTFWTRWIREYLPTLTKRTKWFEDTKAIQNGDLVVVINDARRNGWARGRVLEVIPAEGGRVRRAIIQTSTGVYMKPVSRLAVLEVQNSGTHTKSGFHRGEDVAASAGESKIMSAPVDVISPDVSLPLEEE